MAIFHGRNSTSSGQASLHHGYCRKTVDKNPQNSCQMFVQHLLAWVSSDLHWKQFRDEWSWAPSLAAWLDISTICVRQKSLLITLTTGTSFPQSIKLSILCLLLKHKVSFGLWGWGEITERDYTELERGTYRHQNVYRANKLRSTWLLGNLYHVEEESWAQWTGFSELPYLNNTCEQKQISLSCSYTLGREKQHWWINWLLTEILHN